MERFIADLRQAVALSRRPKSEGILQRSKMFLLNTVMRVFPGSFASRMTKVASRYLGIGDGELPKKTAAMYGLMAALPAHADLDKVVIVLLDKLSVRCKIS